MNINKYDRCGCNWLKFAYSPHQLQLLIVTSVSSSVRLFVARRQNVIRPWSVVFQIDCLYSSCMLHGDVCIYKKAVLSQRWPRNAPHIWMAWKFSGLPDYAQGYFSQNFPLAFVLIHPLKVRTKFKVRSFTRSWDNRGYPKILGCPWICWRSLLS